MICFGKGGGAHFVFKGNLSNNHMAIRDAVVYNNYAFWSGGLRIYYEATLTRNISVVFDTQFVDNESVHNGGGVDIGISAAYVYSIQF